MERIFSVDDIVGTLWKLDPNNNSSSNPVGEHSNGPNAGLENILGQGPAEEIFKKITRVDSDWAFQEFFKFQVSTDSAKAESSDTPEKTMRRNESIWAFQEFLKNYVLNDSCKADGDKREEDADHSCDANPSDAHVCSEVAKLDCSRSPSHGADVHNPEHDDSQSDVGSHQQGHGSLLNPQGRDFNVDVHVHQHALAPVPVADPISESNLIKTSVTDASNLKGPDGIQHHDASHLETPSNNASSINEISDSPEHQVSGALNPLFTGLQNVVPSLGHCNPHEYEIILKRQLDMACAAVASTRVCFCVLLHTLLFYR